MNKLKCEKCGSTDFESRSEDVYYLEIREHEDGYAIAKVVDEDLIGDVSAQAIICSKCGVPFHWEDGVDWTWDNDEDDDDDDKVWDDGE